MGSMLSPVVFSSQIVAVAKNTETTLDLIKNSSNRFILQYFRFFCLTEQGNQDLIISLRSGSQQLFRSGKISISTSGQGVTYPKELREQSITGCFYSEITSVDQEGYGDNYEFSQNKLPILIEANTVITAVIRNQSNIFSHSAEVSIQGLFV